MQKFSEQISAGYIWRTVFEKGLGSRKL